MLQCVRGMCTQSATAGLGYDVLGTKAWLYDLDDTALAGGARGRVVAMPLCRTHANRITVPVGWEFTDRRALGLDVEPVVGAEPSTGAAAAASPLFEPRSRPEPEPVLAPEPAPSPSLLERAFRAAPSR
ncbi:DUF3499 family protein [Candidatus Poriferisodalis sp.]|uniref:DUF3499 family protein n=1 Tax=Candidatus Poriferisodalis sp. TaxID=3101277 RepID=UPI003B012D1A